MPQSVELAPWVERALVIEKHLQLKVMDMLNDLFLAYFLWKIEGVHFIQEVRVLSRIDKKDHYPAMT